MHDGVRVLADVVSVTVHVTVMGVVVMVVIVIGVIVLMGVLDAVSVRVNVQMRWLGCGSVLGHGNLDKAGPQLGVNPTFVSPAAIEAT